MKLSLGYLVGYVLLLVAYLRPDLAEAAHALGAILAVFAVTGVSVWLVAEATSA